MQQFKQWMTFAFCFKTFAEPLGETVQRNHFTFWLKGYVLKPNFSLAN